MRSTDLGLFTCSVIQAAGTLGAEIGEVKGSLRVVKLGMSVCASSDSCRTHTVSCIP